MGVGYGDRLALYLSNSVEFEVLFFAGSKVGAILTPLNPSFKAQEARYQLEDSGAKVCIVEEDLLRHVTGLTRYLEALQEFVVLGKGPIGGGTPLFHEWIAGESTDPPEEPPIDPAEDLVALPYSSGTTGLPKGVMLTHRNLISNYTQFVQNHQITSRDTALLFLPLYHIYGTMIMGGMVAAGGTHVLMKRFEVKEALERVGRHRITLFYGVPPALLAIANYPDLTSFDLSSLRYIMSGAAPLPPEVRQKVQERTGVLTFMGYGLTEASPLTHMNPPVPELVKAESVGPPVSDEEQKVVDAETGERGLPPGEVGELCLRGPHIMKGYWNAPEETARALRNGWLYTGDLVRADEEGYIYIQDRLKEMIKYKGFSIAPAELEALLHQHPQVADCAVIGKPDPEAGEIPKAFIVPRNQKEAKAEDIMNFVRERVAGYKQVREVEFTRAIPRSASGKILRRVLREKESGNP
jgi:long-chain acyl-CoA synthetase